MDTNLTPVPLPPEVAAMMPKTKAERLAENLEKLRTAKPYFHRRPAGMSDHDWRTLRRGQKWDYEDRAAGNMVWVSQASGATMTAYFSILSKSGTKDADAYQAANMGHVRGTYVKRVHGPLS